MCHNHLNIHKEDRKRKHNLEVLDDQRIKQLFTELRKELKEAYKEIILKSYMKIREIQKEAEHSVWLINNLIKSLNQKYVENKLNENFLNEMMNSYEKEADCK